MLAIWDKKCAPEAKSKKKKSIFGKSKKYYFYWTFTGIRKDIERLIVEFK